MKSWKEYANLFANGKFSIWDEEWDDIKPSARIIIGYNSGNIVIEDGSRYGCMMDVNSGTLIARRISDMSDEECLHFAKLYWDFDGYNIESALIEDGICFIKQTHHGSLDNVSFDLRDMRMPQCLYLLQIGVYPGPQSHFDSGEVIDAKEVS